MGKMKELTDCPDCGFNLMLYDEHDPTLIGCDTCKAIMHPLKKRVCSRCRNHVSKSTIGNNENGYKYQCFHCDEDLFSIETELIK